MPLVLIYIRVSIDFRGAGNVGWFMNVSLAAATVTQIKRHFLTKSLCGLLW